MGKGDATGETEQNTMPEVEAASQQESQKEVCKNMGRVPPHILISGPPPPQGGHSARKPTGGTGVFFRG